MASKTGGLIWRQKSAFKNGVNKKGIKNFV